MLSCGFNCACFRVRQVSGCARLTAMVTEAGVDAYNLTGGMHLSQIKITSLTFGYEGSYENIFEDVTLELDTDWRLGLIGRNGRGKTTLLRLLEGGLAYKGRIEASVSFDYFPFEPRDSTRDALTVAREVIAPFDEWEREMELLSLSTDPVSLSRYGDVFERYTACDGFIINSLITAECGKLGISPEVLEHPFDTLSGGEQTKLLLAALFLRHESFLLIDEPTNHLDLEGRETLSRYLGTKSGFILVSHDRAFLDASIDHVLSINRANIELQRGSYSSWKENRDRTEQFERTQDEKLRRQITELTAAAQKARGASAATEAHKHGERFAGVRPDRGALGHTAAKQMKRAKCLEARRERALDEKLQLLKNEEQAQSLKLRLLPPPKKRLVSVSGLSVFYGSRVLFENLSFTVDAGERAALTGLNGCGKSSVIKLLLGQEVPHTGLCELTSGVKVSYVPQDTSFLRGDMRAYIEREQLDEELLKAILRKLDFTRAAFDRRLEELSSGQKKKLLLGAALSRQAHILIWDEPLNYIDILSREQLEELIERYRPTMLFIEHDKMFEKRIATREIAVKQ